MKIYKPLFIMFLPLLSILGMIVQPVSPAAAGTGQGVIAYVVPNDITGDEIHLVDPNGTNDRRIWHTGEVGIEGVDEVGQLAWKPDGSELAFWSTFQSYCSVFGADIYSIWPNGDGFRRITAPPACGANPGLPTGTVVLTVDNFSYLSKTFVIYLEGAPGPKFLSLPGYGTGTVTFTDVMDYGSGIQQWAAGLYGYHQFSDVNSHVDVIPGQTVYGTLGLAQMDRNWSFPTYSSDGAQIAYILNQNTFYYAPSTSTTPGGVGWELLGGNPSMPMSPSHLQYGRGVGHENQVLYIGYDTNTWPYTDGVYLTEKDSSSRGIKLVEAPNIFGLAWLPDGSGFIYSAEEVVYTDDCVIQHMGNIYEYRFGTSEAVRLSNFVPYGPGENWSCLNGPFPRELTISPDGSKIVFEYQAEGDWGTPPAPFDLWIMNRSGFGNGSGERLFVQNGAFPAWSPSDPVVPSPPVQPPSPTPPSQPTPPGSTPYNYRLYLPTVIK